jgi:hypothetical protein
MLTKNSIVVLKAKSDIACMESLYDKNNKENTVE